MNTEDFPPLHPLRQHAEQIEHCNVSSSGVITILLKYPWYYVGGGYIQCTCFEEAAKRIGIAGKTE